MFMARIGIDARFYGTIGKGLGRYTQKLIENLEIIDSENDYFVFLRAENFDEYQPKNSNFEKVLADYRWYTFSEQIRMPRLLKKFRLDLVHFPHFNVPLLYRKKFIITVHDLILVHFPTVRSSTLSPALYWFKFMAYKLVIWSALVRSNRIIAVSEFTKKDILQTYNNIPEKKVIVTYEGCEDYHMESPHSGENILQKYGIIKPYLMYVGNVYPHKNPERLVLAFGKIKEWGNDSRLVFVGGDDYFYARLQKFVVDQKADNVIFAGFVPDDELGVLFQNAQAYIRPSLYEGFELPPLEAMAKGVPVLSSSHECALEILGDSALYFDGGDVDDMARAIMKIQADSALRAKLIKKGYEQITKYDWQRMAAQTLEMYKA